MNPDYFIIGVFLYVSLLIAMKVLLSVFISIRLKRLGQEMKHDGMLAWRGGLYAFWTEVRKLNDAIQDPRIRLCLNIENTLEWISFFLGIVMLLVVLNALWKL